jgi:hypothetical protein
MTDKEKNPPIKEPPPRDDDGADKTVRVDEDNIVIEPPVGVAGGAGFRANLGERQEPSSDAANDAREAEKRKSGKS